MQNITASAFINVDKACDSMLIGTLDVFNSTFDKILDVQ